MVMPMRQQMMHSPPRQPTDEDGGNCVLAMKVEHTPEEIPESPLKCESSDSE